MSATFPSFVLSKPQRIYLLVAVFAAIIQLIVFKLCYPFADFFSDSYSYIFAAANRLDVNIWPIGYSKFLWLFHQLTYSDTAVVAFQYLFGQAIALYFFFTLLYFYAPSRQLSNIIFIFLFFNPLFLYLGNYISSDALFLGLSLLWLVQLLWIIHRPRIYQVFVHALLIAILFTLRYNAMFYPLISAVALVISHRKPVWKLCGIAFPLLLILLFVNHTRNSSYTLTGTRQFSIFGGWQMANNALYMYPFITENEPPPAECREFDRLVKSYFSLVPEELKTVSPRDGAFYIKYPAAPLKQYLARNVNVTGDKTNGISSWGAVAPVYGTYGKFLITRHPVGFTRYFLLPNTFNYCLPPLEKLEVYNLGEKKVSAIAARWFHYPGTRITAVSMNIQGAILLLFPAIFLITNLFFIWILVLWIRNRRNRIKDQAFSNALFLVISLLLVNCAFSILASPIVFRYQVFPMIVCLSFSLMMAERIGIFSDTGTQGS
ncbi:hypothetical protein ACTJJ0_33035 [Chitinophaga sp. 22321]|uniref:Dolichyl-phosphate-mannose-protein mannosyltransferase n=1 Tax=Chitinophaga hostae TaxID=2831022 RepID=A0ABS5JAK0_9BACT|nr:hypothetical protein [Chitinophaga hostae]MBS0032053.1 hypothetical protein [Chitinophaga hostae]